MKLFLSFLLAGAVTASALAFDEASFGAGLNGWHRDGSAHYALDGAQYRTLKPVVTTDADGNSVILVTVIHRANSWAEVPFDLEVTLAPDGSVRSTRITGSPRGKKVDTGAISPPSAPEGESAGAFHPVAEMKKSLFASFESQASQAAEAKDTRKRDLLARICGPEPIDPAALSAGLRYNLDLILRTPRTASK